MRLLHIIPDYESHASSLSTCNTPSTTGTQAIPSPFGTPSSRTTDIPASHLPEVLARAVDFDDLAVTWFPSVTSDPPELEIVECTHIIPPYAILSHTWEDEEVSFQDMQNPQLAKRKKGYTKIMAACRIARDDGFDYIWIDSCCINKESSAELSEALNSMYRYYENSEVCYAYLADVRKDEDTRSPDSSFRWCKWFTRGWTLQELLASPELVFYDKGWMEIGTKRSLHDVITAITGIPMHILFGGDINTVSIAKRMSWAALRKTTRPEDLAYSLMGIFGVNMPPLYGEGLQNAFGRLQREIIISYDDRSIFAWMAARHDHDLHSRGLFARSPSEFRHSGDVGKSELIGKDSSFTMTNSGLRIHLPLRMDPEHGGRFLAFLSCKDETGQRNIAVHLQCRDVPHFVRCQADQLVLDPGPLPSLHDVKQIDVREGPRDPTRTQLDVKWSLPDAWFCTQWHCLWLGNQIRKRATPEPRKITLNDRDEMLLGFKCGQLAFGAVIQFTNDALSTNLVMSPHFNSSYWSEQGPPASKDLRHGKGSWHESLDDSSSRIPVSYFEGGQRQAGRISRFLENGETVSLTAYKVSSQARWAIEIQISSQNITIPRSQLQPPMFGFMIQIKSKLGFHVKRVIPEDFFRVNHSPQDVYISIDPTDSEEPSAFRIVLLECYDQVSLPLKMAVILGIHDSKAWSELVYDLKGKETVDSILQAGAESKSRRWEGEEPFAHYFEHPEFFRLEDGWYAIQAIVRIGRKGNSTVQPGSHWALIEVDG